MSFSGLISGAECAVPSNPLSQVLKHTEGDRSLQQDRVNNAGPSFNQFRQPSNFTPNQQDLAQARSFFDGTISPGPSSSSMSSRPMSSFTPPVMVQSAQPTEQWIMQSQPTSRVESGWATEFKGPSQAVPVQPQGQMSMQSNVGNASAYTNPSFMTRNMNYHQMGGMQQKWQMQHQYYQGQPVIEGKGKNRQIDFDSAFEEIAAQVSRASIIDDTSGPSEAEADLIAQFADSADLNEIMERSGLGDLVSDPDASQEDVAKWEAQLNEMMAQEREELDTDYKTPMQHAYEQDMTENAFNDEYIKFDDNGIPVLGDYIFESNNRYLDPSNSGSMLERAKSLLAAHGSLSEAALMLEAAIQRNELGEGGYETWILLGETRNQDEHEQAGMRALQEGVRRAEQAGAPGNGMVSLAISYTNESYDRASYNMLLRWIRARFPEHPVPDISTTMASWHTHEKITDVFIALAREQHARGVLDPDVQIGLGVLFYTNGEYDRAKDCFESALAVRPDDFQLWNRLGSSLSNGNKPEDALGAYREALSLRPTYTRAIYNVGVACLNINLFHEAAEHFLSALWLQGSSGGESNEQLWFTLRRAFLNLERNDLAEMTNQGNRPNLEAFKKEGFDF